MPKHISVNTLIRIWSNEQRRRRERIDQELKFYKEKELVTNGNFNRIHKENPRTT
ncbi:MAG: hypothetical protein A4E55_00220 [Pelotomaculum sp. PtaU1.Bin035]|nr:MAG: hypothetical protein A4E55_00220 [Pelotomaculum sp. PtaU1.Bin035]